MAFPPAAVTVNVLLIRCRSCWLPYISFTSFPLQAARIHHSIFPLAYICLRQYSQYILLEQYHISLTSWLNAWSCCLSPVSGQRGFTKFWRHMNVWDSWFRKEKLLIICKSNQLFCIFLSSHPQCKSEGVGTLNNDKGDRNIRVQSRVTVLSKAARMEI